MQLMINGQVPDFGEGGDAAGNTVSHSSHFKGAVGKNDGQLLMMGKTAQFNMTQPVATAASSFREKEQGHLHREGIYVHNHMGLQNYGHVVGNDTSTSATSGGAG